MPERPCNDCSTSAAKHALSLPNKPCDAPTASSNARQPQLGRTLSQRHTRQQTVCHHRNVGKCAHVGP
eukprot:840702-Alexandrium_andersonii.AAC.1